MNNFKIQNNNNHLQVGPESGFQSSASLTSLLGPMYESPITALSSSHLTNVNSELRTSSESLLSLTSGISSLQLPGVSARRSSLTRSVNMPGRRSVNNLSARQSASRLSDQVSGRHSVSNVSRSRVSLGRRSEGSVQFAQYRPAQWFLKPIFHEVPQRETGPVFVGRQWLWTEMVSRLRDARGLVITGAVGTGKTAISLQLVHNSCFGLSRGGQAGDVREVAGQVVAYHFCQLDNSLTCRLSDWIHSTAAQLSQSPQLSAYHQLLSTDHSLRARLSLSSCQSDPHAAFTQGILQPLSSLKRSGRITCETCIILLDAVGDTHYHRPDYGHTIISFLNAVLPSFPGWLKLVLTVRSDKMELVETLGLAQISLDQWKVDKRLEADMSEFVSRRISRSQNIQRNITPQSGRVQDENPQVKFQNYLVSTARGCFLFLKLTLDLVERGHLVIKSSSFNLLPVSLAEVFMLEFNLKFPSVASFQKVSDVLSVCLASLRPLSLSELYHTVSSLYVEQPESWQEFLLTFQSLAGTLVTRRDDTVMLFHPSLRDWLIRRTDTESKKFLCDPRTGHAALALRMSRLESPVNDAGGLELCHHILKAHLYRNISTSVLSRDLQSSWISLSSDEVSLSLAHQSNLYSPNINVSRLLLLSGASPDVNTDLALLRPIITVYASLGYHEMVSLLLEFGADINIATDSGQSALNLASISGHLETVRLLVENGAKLNQVDTAGECALVGAARHGQFAVVEHLVSCDWTSLSPGELGLAEVSQQAAVVSAHCGHQDILEFLLDMSEVQVDRVDSLMAETALGAAAGGGHKTCCQALLRRGAGAEATNLLGVSPLMVASREGHYGLCDLLVGAGARLDQADSQGRTGLMEASLGGHLGVVEMLVRRGARLELEDRQGSSALLLASSAGRGEVVRFLLAEGADLSHVDSQGRSGLDLAAGQADPVTVMELLDRGAVMEHVDMKGMRPLDRAVSSGHLEVVKCFLKRGAKLGPTTWRLAEDKPLVMLTLLNKLLEDGNTLFRKNKLEEAAMRYQYAAKRVPSQPGHEPVFDKLRVHLLLNLARVRRRMFDMEVWKRRLMTVMISLILLQEAIRLISRVLEIQPTSSQALVARAKCHQETGDLQAALRDLNTAISLRPGDTTLLGWRADLHFKIQAKTSLVSDDKSDKSQDSSSGVSSTADTNTQS